MSAGGRGKAKASVKSGRVTPGEHLRAELQRLGLDQVAVGRATGVSRQSINNIINGRQTISRAMAGKLGRLTGRSSDYWLSERFPEEGPGQSTAGAPARFAVTGILVNHQIASAVKDGIIVIEPFSLQNLQAASIDLTLNEILTVAGGDRIDIGHGKSFVLEPGCSVNATTTESIELPRDYLGRAGTATRLGSLGVIASNQFHIEPGFKGRLRFWLFNAGGSPIRLRALDPVIGLEFFRLGAAADDAATT